MYRYFWFWNVYKLYRYIVYNIKTCDKYDASSSVNEQIKTYILTTGGGGGGGGDGEEENTKTTYIHDHFGESKYKNFIFTTIVFLGGGGGGGGRKRGEIKFLKKTAVKMTVCLARFRSKGSLIICEIRNIDQVRVYRSFYNCGTFYVTHLHSTVFHKY